jgi:hypothetical protein
VSASRGFAAPRTQAINHAANHRRLAAPAMTMMTAAKATSLCDEEWLGRAANVSSRWAYSYRGGGPTRCNNGHDNTIAPGHADRRIRVLKAEPSAAGRPLICTFEGSGITRVGAHQVSELRVLQEWIRCRDRFCRRERRGRHPAFCLRDRRLFRGERLIQAYGQRPLVSRQDLGHLEPVLIELA